MAKRLLLLVVLALPAAGCAEQRRFARVLDPERPEPGATTVAFLRAEAEARVR